MKQLTYADRENLLRTFKTLRNQKPIPDRELLNQVEEWVRSIQPRFGFEQGLARDARSLCKYLMGSQEVPESAEIARGALLYLLRNRLEQPKGSQDLGLLGDAYVAGYAVHEIRLLLGEKAHYSLPQLTHSEKTLADDLFLEFLDNPHLVDTELIQESRVISRQLESLSEAGLFRRLRHNIDFLLSTLEDESRTEEQRDYARAGLSYLVQEEDAIDDSLGLIGFLDDAFMVQLAVDFIEPEREPLLEVMDAVFGSWPFLNSLTIDDGSGGRPLSEFMIVNSALACRDLRNGGGSGLTVLAAPRTGPVPFVLGLLSAVALVQEKAREQASKVSLQEGQKVQRGNVVRIFTGVETIKGVRRFGLLIPRTKQGLKYREKLYFPLTEMDQWIPVDSSRDVRGQLRSRMEHSKEPLNALEYLHLLPGVVTGVDSQILVVTPTVQARRLADSLTLYGTPVRDAVPMGSLKDSGDVQSWSPRFGSLVPILVFASDLDRACDFIEESPDSTHLLIVNFTGRNDAQGNLDQAREHLSKAKTIIEETGYHRRDPDVKALEEHLLGPV